MHTWHYDLCVADFPHRGIKHEIVTEELPAEKLLKFISDITAAPVENMKKSVDLGQRSFIMLYCGDKSTAWRTKLYGGTAWVSCIWNTI